MNPKLSSIDYKYDPAALAEMGAPEDEYDDEAKNLMIAYKKGDLKSQKDVELFTRKQVQTFFDNPLSPASVNVHDLSGKLWQELNSGSTS